MDIRVQSVKFNADVKLLDFINKKVSKLEKFYEGINNVEVILSLTPGAENKGVKIKVNAPGKDLYVDRNAATFEDAVVDCVDILKEELVKIKEKRMGK